jgi:citrate lyase subunit gamma (acyl carrier protein)
MESSDIMITLVPNTGGIEIELQSLVEKQYGRQIREVIEKTLAQLRVSGAKVTAVDKGALDCTIAARLKTAVYRAADSAAYEWEALP